MYSTIAHALVLLLPLVAGHEESSALSAVWETVTRTKTITSVTTAYSTSNSSNSSVPFPSFMPTNNSTINDAFSVVTVDVTSTTTIFVYPTQEPDATYPQRPGGSLADLDSQPNNANGKRGLAYNDAKYTKSFGGSNSKVTWQYNWNANPYAPHNLSAGQLNPSLKFLPQLWSLAAEQTTAWHPAVAVAIKDHGADTLLAYNEPDLCKPGAGAACMSDIPAAVQGYKDMMSRYYKKGLKLGMPAVTNGENGIPWAKKFLELCSDCQIDVAPMHFYTEHQAPFDYFTGYVKNFTALVKPRKVWITEFGLTSGTEKEKAGWLRRAMEWLDGNDDVERYAYFYAGPEYLCNKDGSLTALGKLYNE